MQPPLEMVALDDDGAGDLAVGAALKLRADVDQECAFADRGLGFERPEASQPLARPREKALESPVVSDPPALPDRPPLTG